jgi:nitrite reductase (cytochrome c-552)
MSEPTPAPAPRSHFLGYLTVIVLTAAATYGIVALLMNVMQRKEEAKQVAFKVVDLTEDSVDPAEWGKNFPRQYDSYLLTAQDSRTPSGNSEAVSDSKLEADPRLKRIFAGYAFSVDFNRARGHAHMLEDQDKTLRVKNFKQPGACLHCHAAVLPLYRQAGDGDVKAGFEKVCAMPLSEARKLTSHPVTCLDCHDPKTNQLRTTRPGFQTGIAALARSDEPLPHLPSIERWRQGDRKSDYDPNTLASRQEMRSFVCGQCHVEYYFKGDGKIVTFPWARGLKVEEIEAYYDKEGFSDWTHAETGAKVLKAQHPEFETWNQGTHARAGVSCADCHMPYLREGAIKVSDHRVRSPMRQVNHSCQTCHRATEAEMTARVETIQTRHKGLMNRAEDALVQLYDAIQEAKSRGVTPEKLADVFALQRKAQWRLDFSNAENSNGFHAPQECARILGEAIDYARQGQVAAVKLMPKP